MAIPLINPTIRKIKFPEELTAASALLPRKFPTIRVNWTVVCPSSFFDSEGALTGNYEIGTEEQVIFNEAGESRVTYEDLAMAMLDIAEADNYNQKQITVLTK